ncbi:MAG: S-layer homology domain-containing protein [Eubacteriales bacterium]|nr:S-layer homology domain-containing protein [Eubacteriales bacterium]
MKIKKLCMVLIAAIAVLQFTVPVCAAAFEDVSDHRYEEEIKYCRDKGFVIGVTPDTFNPDEQLTRAHFAILWCRSLKIKEVNHRFADITRLEQYFDSPAIVLSSLGLFMGKSETSFSPEDFMTREQVAVITARTYGLKAADEDDYQRYEDHASVSDWARESVSACINADVFRDLYDNDSFNPGEPVTRAEICKLIFNLMMPDYRITVGELTGGTITASPAVAREGKTITLTVTPNEGKQLKAGTLKYDDTVIEGTTFTMPAKNVTVTAEFEDEAITLKSIKITSEPTKTTYVTGDKLSLDGLVITATYSDASTKIIDAITSIRSEPTIGEVLNTVGTLTVNIYYSEGGEEATASFDIEVTEAEK